MGKYLLEIPDRLHDKLRHESINSKVDMKDIVITAIKEYLNPK